MGFKNRILRLFLWCAMLLCFPFVMLGQSKPADFLENTSITLAPPSIQVDSLLFTNSAKAKILLRQEGAILRYTLDESEVTQDSPIYQTPLELDKTLKLKARAFHSDFKPSETISVTTRKILKDLANTKIEVLPKPNDAYRASGSKTLIDGQKGNTNFRQGNLWLGFQDSEISITLSFDQPTSIGKVIVSVLNDQDSWIFLPHQVSVASEGNSVGNATLTNSAEKMLKQSKFIEVNIAPDVYSELQLTLIALEGIPEWHSGKGTPPWTFIDEILIE